MEIKKGGLKKNDYPLVLQNAFGFMVDEDTYLGRVQTWDSDGQCFRYHFTASASFFVIPLGLF